MILVIKRLGVFVEVGDDRATVLREHLLVELNDVLDLVQVGFEGLGFVTEAFDLGVELFDVVRQFIRQSVEVRNQLAALLPQGVQAPGEFES